MAFFDQWEIKYGEKEWKKAVEAHIESPAFKTFNEPIKDAFRKAVGWLEEWGVSRKFGMGSKLPCDPQYLIESLSDSTIYMAYYTISHLLQGNSFLLSLLFFE